MVLNLCFLLKVEYCSFLFSLIFFGEKSQCLKCWQIFILSGFFNMSIMLKIVLHGFKILMLTLQESELWTS